MLLQLGYLSLCLLGGPSQHPVFQSPITVSEGSEAFAAVSKQLGDAPVVRAIFAQEKHLTALSRPLRSNGSFLFSATKGVYWHTHTPFDAIFIITPEAIIQIEDGERTFEVKASEQPVIHGFTRVFLPLFGGDPEALEQSFQLYFSGDATQWVLGLEPRSKLLEKLIGSIVLTGSKTIESVVIQERSGDATHILFSEQVTEPPVLTPEENAYFEQ